LELSHVVQWRCSIVLPYISHHLQEEEGLSLKHMAWPKHPEILQERETFTTMNMPYVHIKTDNTLSLLKKTVIHKSNPKTRTLCFWMISSPGSSVSNWLPHLHYGFGTEMLG
jgi:hypothetical protein